MNLTHSPSFAVSIVVLCYNGLDEVTRPCVESILKNTQSGSYELILIDNASSDGTPGYLKTLAEAHSHVQIQLNNENKGYAGGNNDGIRLARGDYIVLLNNDTLVPHGWLERLLLPLDVQPDVGLVGPITNSAGNEQRVDLSGLTEVNFEVIAGAYTQRQSKHWFTTEKLGFFCVALRRNLTHEIGGLDEQFGIGMFEDDDYCARTRQRGYRLAVAEDCFVYHKGSVSFKKLATAEYLNIFNKNREYFFRKHGKFWLFSDIALATWKKINDDLSTFFDSGDASALERVQVRRIGMSGALAHLKALESQSGQVGESKLAEIELAEKQKQLMEMSDWASGMKRELDSLSSSRVYRLLKWAEKMGI